MIPPKEVDSFGFLEKRIASLSGVDAFEIYQVDSRQLELESQEGALESSHKSISRGLAIRLFQDRGIGFASSSASEEAFLERMVQLAYNSLRIVQGEAKVPLSDRVPRGDFNEEWDEGLLTRPFQDKVERVIALESGAREFDARVSRVRGARYQEEETTVTLRNSAGFSGGCRRTLCEMSLMVVAEQNGESEAAWESEFSPFFNRLDPARPARRAASRAVSLLGGRPIRSRKAAVLLAPAVGASFLSVLASSFFGDQVLKGRSSLRGKMGEEIYSPRVTFVDDGRLAGGYRSFSFDGEGTPGERKEIVREGRLRGFLHDRVSAILSQASPTGNGIRSVWREMPQVGVTNFFVKPGEASEEDLLRDMGSGFWVTDLIGVHTANSVTGDFSLGATGFWVDRGSRQFPVRGVAVSGNVHALMKRVASVGSDLMFYHSFGSPSLLVSEMDIGGT